VEEKVETKVESKMENRENPESEKRAMSEGQVICEGSEIFVGY
jgi:hypothetical protein